MNLRKDILALINEKRLTIYRLGIMAEQAGICTKQTVYNWLDFDSDIHLSKAEALYDLLDGEI